MSKVGVISLGCSKNLVDSENLMGYLVSVGYELTNDPTEAEMIIINTCGFITPAKEESINTILEMAEYKKRGSLKHLVVVGCLSERYPNELMSELPEVDLFWGVRDHAVLIEKLLAMTGGEPLCAPANHSRVLATPPYSAYLRIADGCDNRCTYCAIPLIRGGRKSVPMEELVDEARSLADRGVRELTVIAQDTSAYGTDLYGKPMLRELLIKLAEIEKLVWIRVLYSYPNTITEELVDAIVGNEKLVNYIDMPIQHIAPDILKRMNRHGTSEHIREISDYIRHSCDEFILRTTVMTGFPGETDDEFGQLAEFLREHQFDRLGAFAFSEEEGTEACDMPNQIDERVRAERLDALMKLQSEVSQKRNSLRIGKTYDVIVEEAGGGEALGRSYAEAPDVDGKIKVKLKSSDIKPGDFIRARIVKAGIYDLFGEEV